MDINKRIIFSGVDFSAYSIILEPLEITQYCKDSHADRFITCLSGQGIITIDSVDFYMSRGYSSFVKQDSQFLIANIDERSQLCIIETMLYNDVSSNVQSCVNYDQLS